MENFGDRQLTQLERQLMLQRAIAKIQECVIHILQAESENRLEDKEIWKDLIQTQTDTIRQITTLL